jgi:hypothetical protein
MRPLPKPLPALPLLLALAAGPGLARAEGTAGCHCFRDRTFDPARPAAADPYILATTRSSLLSAAFGVAKSELVRAVMGGTAPEDLWVAWWAGSRLNRGAPRLLEARAAKGSWKAALAGAGTLGEPFDAALAAGAPDGQLAALAVDDVLVRRLAADPGTLRALRGAGATTEETVLATLLSIQIGAPVLPLLAQVKAGRVTWGALLADAGVAPQQLDGLIRNLLK